MRDFHDLVHHDSQSLQLEHDGHNIRVRTSGFACTVHASKLNPAADASPRFVESVDVWKNFAYTFDRERGQDGREHLWSPGTFVSRLRAGAHKHAIALELEARTEADASLTSVRSLPSIEDHIQAEALRLAPML
jgi:glycogen debranching enzyme